MELNWQSIETSPMDRYILIRQGKGYVPDLVRWRIKREARIEHGTKYLAVPAGWFRPSGGRSHIADPKEWLNIPD